MQFKTLFAIKIKAKIVYVLLIFLFAQGLNYLWVVKPVYLEKLAIGSKNKELKEQMVIKYRKLESFKETKEELLQINHSIKNELRFKKLGFNFSELLEEIYQSGMKEAVEFELLQPGLVQNNLFYNKRKIKMRLHGKYTNLIHFFNRISELNYFLVADEFSLKQVNKSPELSFDLSLSCYQFHNISIKGEQAENVDVHLNKEMLFKTLTLPPRAIKNPFQHFYKREEQVKLAEYNLDEIKLFGFINKKNKIWAIVGSNKKNLVHIQIGDYLGKEEAKFSSYNKSAIQLRLKGDDKALPNKKIVQLKFTGS